MKLSKSTMIGIWHIPNLLGHIPKSKIAQILFNWAFNTPNLTMPNK
jgi:hypothetical protein